MHGSLAARRGLLTLLLLLCATCLPLPVGASGPRYVTGPPYFTGPPGAPIPWRQTRLLYYTDPGNLSASVSHAAADSLVASAAAVWNLPIANMTLAQGGSLAEDVNGQNVYLDSSGMVYPDDVMSSNAAAVPLAVIYDLDGSVTDTLLGAGASDPSSCRQNAVTESVDAFDPAGYILHAVLVLNGRCTGSAAEMQLDLQYKVMRAFGRVLGLAWSQTNDNVFTGTPAPTYGQAMNWPILHPLEIICGPYSYQCLPSPFQLRPDDMASMALVYPVSSSGTVPAGKQPTLQSAAEAAGIVSFPTGQGMAGVNVLVRRQSASGGLDGWFEASGVTGTIFRRTGAPPFATPDTSIDSSFGTTDPGAFGKYFVAYIPVTDPSGQETVITSTEPVNPLYMGTYSPGPYAAGTVAPSGSPPVPQTTLGVGGNGYAAVDFPIADAAPTCGNGEDGTASAPMEAPAGGWWNGLLCGYGHTSYADASVRPARSFTVEVTALNEQGLATIAKAMPVIAVFASTDAPNGSPSLGVTPGAFQALGVGTTSITASTGQGSGVRLAIADQRGEGRPDFAYQARLFYADSLVPERIAPAGGQVTISGMGFRQGNSVKINGVAATVLSWTSTQIVLSAPAMTTAGATDKMAVDVVVQDRTTGASSTMTGAFTYDSSTTLPNLMKLVSAPSGSVYVGGQAATAFAVQVVAADGVTPVAGDAVAFTVPAGSARFAACGAATCTVRTDANGMASTAVTPLAAGSITLRASDGSLMQMAGFNAIAQASSMLVVQAPGGNQKVNQATDTPFTVRVYAADGKTGLPGRSITFTVPTGSATFGGCANSVCVVTTDYSGAASVTVMPTAVGPVTLQATDGDVNQQISFTAIGNSDLLQTKTAPPATIYLNGSGGEFVVRLLASDGTTPVWNGRITFTAPSGISFGACGSNVCQMLTNTSGEAGSTVIPQTLGTFTLTATFGTLVQTVTVTVSQRTPSLRILSAPSGNVSLGAPASTPFTAEVLQGDGVTPMTGENIVVAGPVGAVTLSACGRNTCILTADGSGIVSTTVTPLQAGQITLSASYAPYVQNATFTATGQPETMKVVAQPSAAGAYVGDTQTLTVQVIGTDGVTPVAGDHVHVTVVSGPFTMACFGYTDCGLSTDANGLASIQGAAYATGPISIQFTDYTATQIFNFNAIAHSNVMRLVSAPTGNVVIGKPAAVAFSVQVFASDGSTPAPGQSVAFSTAGGSVSFGSCTGTPCLVTADVNGIASTTVTPLATGTISLLATDGPANQSATFTAVAPTDMMRLVSAPASGSFVGSVAPTPFAVQVLLPDGVTPEPGKVVTFSVTAGSASLTACGSSTCSVTTDANGRASTGVTPSASGSIALLASEQGNTVSATFTAVIQPDTLVLVSSPGAGVYVGATAVSSFSVRLLLPDGVTPVAGVAITFSLAGSGAGGVWFAACGAASCTVATAANGIASTSVTGVTAGAVTLLATAAASVGAPSLSAPFQVVASQYSMNALQAQTYIAEGGTISLKLAATALDNGSPAANQPVQWTGSTTAVLNPTANGFVLGPDATSTDATGGVWAQAQLGPMVAGTQATATACAWTAVCATFTAFAVAESALQPAILTGGLQAVSGGSAFTPLTVQITDGAGHPVVAASVSVYQTVTAQSVPCPAQGRCPAASILASNVRVVESDLSGRITLTPLTVPGTSTQTEVALSVGTQGFATAVLSSQP